MSVPRTVLFFSWAPFFSGAERALVILVEHLDRTRYRPVVVVGTRGELASELRAHDVPVHHVPVVYTGLRTLPAWFLAVTRDIRLGRREQATLVHSNDVPSFQPAGYAARWLGVPAVTHVRFPDSRVGFGWFLKPGFTRALFVSEALRTEAVAEAPGLFGGRSDVVHDGVRLPDLPESPGRRRLRADLGLPPDGPVVGFAGQISEIKGIWEFIDAAAILVDRGTTATFALLGDDLKGQGALRRTAERLVADRGLASRIRFLGFRADAPRLIPAFDVVVVPSHVEPLGNATLEAMASARPVVGSRVGGIPEMVVDGETGLLVPPRDAARLAEAVEVLLRDPARAEALGRAGRARAQVAFSPARHARQVEAVYDGLLESSRS